MAVGLIAHSCSWIISQVHSLGSGYGLQLKLQDFALEIKNLAPASANRPIDVVIACPLSY